jgi:hypothetical protein
MATRTGITGISADSWQVTILPQPKRFSRGAAYGFCNGYAVGDAERLRSGSLACWWPDGKPELLGLEGHESLMCGRARGDTIPGLWRGASGDMGAVAWKIRNGRPTATILHDEAYESTWCTAAGGGAIVGAGKPPAMPGLRARDVGLLWRDGSTPATLTADGDVKLLATDGTRVAGSVKGRAMYWPSINAAPIDLTPAGMTMSEVQDLDGDLQVGTAWKGFRARAGCWRGTAASFVDLTPKGYQTSSAFGAVRGYQVGFVRAKDTTRDGSGGSDNRAVIWQGASDRWFNLNALLPSAKYNASTALAIDIRGDVLQVCGRAIRYELSHPGTPQESHAVPVAHPVLWTARLG